MQQADQNRESEEQREFQAHCRSYGLSTQAITRLTWMYQQYGPGAALTAASIAQEEIRRLFVAALKQGQVYAAGTGPAITAERGAARDAQ